MEHFGCRVMTNEPKLSRSNYAPITLTTRKNGFFSSEISWPYLVGKKGLYSSMDEALSAFFRVKGNSIVDKYVAELDKYRKLINDIKVDDKVAKGYYAQYINDLQKSEIKFFYGSKCKDWEEKGYLSESFCKQLGNILFIDQFSDKYADRYWEKFEKKLNKIKSLEKFLLKSKLFCIQWYEMLAKKTIDKKFINEADESLLQVQKILDDISLVTIEDMLEGDYLKPEWLSSDRTYRWPDSWKTNLPDIPLSIMRKIVQEEKFPYHTDEMCEKLQERALYNFDLNMAFYETLDRNEFNSEIENFLSEHPKFTSVTDLKRYKNSTGIYIMVLDEYKQIYIGITHNSKLGIKGRIQQHWNNTKTLDRLIFGGIDKSILSIDSFKHLDTTRIFVCTDVKNNDLDNEENNLVEKAFSPKFVANRTSGGGHDFLDAISGRKYRDLE